MQKMERTPAAPYMDPLDWIWIRFAAQLGLQIRRDSTVYASTDGQGTLTIGTPETLDADDCLTQMILHEVCHGLVQGEQSFLQPDWGLPNQPEEIHTEAITREHACLRLQAALLRPLGLHQLLAPTTQFRVYYDQLPENPLAAGSDPAIPLAQAGMALSQRSPFAPGLQAVLSKTAAVHRLCGENNPQPGPVFFQRTSQQAEPPHSSLWHSAPPPVLHSIGVASSREHSSRTCQSCVWLTPQGNQFLCRHAQQRPSAKTRVASAEQACVLYESTLDCQACAACCQSAFTLVPLRRKDILRHKRPEWVERKASTWSLKRQPSTQACIALQTTFATPRRYQCTVYDDRPQTCKDVAPASAACLTARKRMGYVL